MGAEAVMLGLALARATDAPGRGFHWGPEAHHPRLPRGHRVAGAQVCLARGGSSTALRPSQTAPRTSSGRSASRWRRPGTPTSRISSASRSWSRPTGTDDRGRGSRRPHPRRSRCLPADLREVMQRPRGSDAPALPRRGGIFACLGSGSWAVPAALRGRAPGRRSSAADRRVSCSRGPTFPSRSWVRRCAPERGFRVTSSSSPRASTTTYGASGSRGSCGLRMPRPVARGSPVSPRSRSLAPRKTRRRRPCGSSTPAARANPVPCLADGTRHHRRRPAPPPRSDPSVLTRMSPCGPPRTWHDTSGLDVYRPYLTAADAPAGLTSITSPSPASGCLTAQHLLRRRVGGLRGSRSTSGTASRATSGEGGRDPHGRPRGRGCPPIARVV